MYVRNCFVGVDPGKSGAYAIIFPDRVVVIPWDDYRFVDDMDYIANHPYNPIVCVESVHAMPKQGVTSTFTFGKNAGFIEGVLTAYKLPYELVPPKSWKKMFSLTGEKQDSIDVCKRLFPDVPLRKTEKCRTDDDGMAEALLMAEYAKRALSGAPASQT